ncbi:MAG: methyltransferase [Thermoplasmata archaeon]|nr:MAG: methyltransferase [Thermoplasmata archaeon]
MEQVPIKFKKKNFEIFLEKVPDFKSPDAKMEQYKTPAPIAADILFNALSSGDVIDKHVVDLGCGTGIFAIGAKMLGAQKVQGLDIDSSAIELAREFSLEHRLEIEFDVKDVAECEWMCDTVIQNPPFGAQTKRADRVFLETAARIGEVMYSIHNANTREFIANLIDKLGYSIDFEKKYKFKIEHTFDFHTKPSKENEVILFRAVRKA